MVVPKVYDAEILKDVEVGAVVRVLSEFDSPTKINAKFQGFLMGRVDSNGQEYLLGINKTSYKAIADAYGENTQNWVGKDIVYKGKQKMGAMEGRLWEAVG